ncbi:uncharacterized protein LTHEOB_10518 [Lasiodiplodia theobromae]|uniref:uncharacterized protein n=1 Tax=Lasiodiplodia theobromae TaxID=45133 RepID=UPI0015C38136|nr:uncharacterized protein LTHEOB_10518 [Lasiodiplodia theobromae]KAF4539126.1 hypothetical protein LTHEOB_10518 [Lasiodiplodia theobromae]
MPRASPEDGKGLEDPLAPASIAASYRMFDATAAPVPQQLSYHFYSSFRPGPRERSLDRGSINKVIQQTVPEKTMTDGSHVTDANDIEILQVTEATPGPAAKGLEAGSDSNLKKDLTRGQQEYQNPKEHEVPTAPKKRFSDIELPQVASKKAKMTASDSSLSPNISIDVPDSSKTRTEEPYVSTKIIDDRPARTAVQRNSSYQHERHNQDDTDDDEDKPQVLTEGQNSTSESIDCKVF